MVDPAYPWENGYGLTVDARHWRPPATDRPGLLSDTLAGVHSLGRASVDHQVVLSTHESSLTTPTIDAQVRRLGTLRVELSGAGGAPLAGVPVGLRSVESGLVVRREKKGRGGKTVTRISGLGDQDLPALARDLKRALGCGATVEEGDVLVQGAQVERAAAWLEQRFGRTVVRGN